MIVLALQDNFGKNIKKKSVQITNFYKTVKDSGRSDISQAPNTARKFNKDNHIQMLYKIMHKKAQDYLNSKRAAQDQELSEDSGEEALG